MNIEQTHDDKIIDLLNDGNKKKAKAFLIYEYDATEKEANEHIKLTCEEHNITISNGKNDMEAMVRTLRENHGIPRKELAQLMSESSGSTVSTANHMISALTFAKEYHKQETE